MNDAVHSNAAARDKRRRGMITQLAWMLILAAPVGAALGFAAGYLGERENLPAHLALVRDALNSWLFLAVMFVVVLAWGVLATLSYWRVIDELAREAHKRAWFWGGSIGMGAGLWALAAGAQIEPFASMTMADMGAVGLMMLGGAITYGCGLVGYGIAWAIIWWRAR